MSSAFILAFSNPRIPYVAYGLGVIGAAISQWTDARATMLPEGTGFFVQDMLELDTIYHLIGIAAGLGIMLVDFQPSRYVEIYLLLRIFLSFAFGCHLPLFMEHLEYKYVLCPAEDRYHDGQDDVRPMWKREHLVDLTEETNEKDLAGWDVEVMQESSGVLVEMLTPNLVTN